jgi:hypothetical protein
MIAVQCILNALLDLKTVFFLSSPCRRAVPNDAVNMYNATGVPAIFWSVLWILSRWQLLCCVAGYVDRRDKASMLTRPAVWQQSEVVSAPNRGKLS